MTSYGQVFGLPVIVTVPRKGCTYRMLYETISSQISRVVNEPKKKKKAKEEAEGEGEKGTAEESESTDSEMKETQEGTVQDGMLVLLLLLSGVYDTPVVICRGRGDY